MANLEMLPEDCFAYILALTSPSDACRASLASSTIRSSADSDPVWEKFLPFDYQGILSRLVIPFAYCSKKELFLRLCNPHLIDGGRKVFSLTRSTGKICCRLRARELSIASGGNPLYWSWRPHLESRFAEVAELRTIWWLEINGKINTSMLSPKTIYVACLIVKFAERAHGLNTLPSEVSVEVGKFKSQGTVNLRRGENKKNYLQHIFFSNRIDMLRSRRVAEGEERGVCERDDGWIEIELGSFYNEGGDEEVTMCLREVEGVHLKGGLIVEGIEVRPKE